LIFDSLEFLDGLPLDSYVEYFGNTERSRSGGLLRRSNMMLNPLELKHLNSMDDSPADMITLNLEDAIAPSRKREALHNIALFLSNMKSSKSFIIVRVNPLDEGGEEEIRFLNRFDFDAVRVAKVRSQEQIDRALQILDDDKELHISLETKEVLHALGGLSRDDRLTTANLGILDLLTSLGLPQSIIQLRNPTVDYILSKFLVDAKTAGIHPISFMFQEYHDTDGFRAWCEHEKMMGFQSKACMGPKQVAIANEVFATDTQQIARAIEIKRVFEEHSGRGVNGFMSREYGFIDEPIYRDALLVLGNMV